jgi:hypothetical protein
VHNIVRGEYTRITPYGPSDAIRLHEFSDVEVRVAQLVR